MPSIRFLPASPLTDCLSSAVLFIGRASALSDDSGVESAIRSRSGRVIVNFNEHLGGLVFLG
jgi:hypothetical protein